MKFLILLIFMWSPIFFGLILAVFGAWLKLLYSTRIMLFLVGIVIIIPIYVEIFIIEKLTIPIALLSIIIIGIALLVSIKMFVNDRNIEKQIIFAINEQTNKFDNYNISISEYLPHIKENPERIKNIISFLSNKGKISSKINVYE